MFAPEFFNAKLSYYVITIGKNGSLPIISNEYLIDNNIGALEDAKVVDLCKNNKKQLLVNNHINNGSVFIFDFPNDFPQILSVNFTKTQIATDFNVHRYIVFFLFLQFFVFLIVFFSFLKYEYLHVCMSV